MRLLVAAWHWPRGMNFFIVEYNTLTEREGTKGRREGTGRGKFFVFRLELGYVCFLGRWGF